MNVEKAKVLVLGTFHMAEHEGLYSNKRQTEIEELVSKLVNFKPTKIAVEKVPEDSVFTNEKYRQYKLGTYNLEMNEIFQIGFRLGVRLGHEQIYSVDWMGDADMDYGEIEKWVKVNQPDLFNEIYNDLFVPELTKNKRIIDYYKELNDPIWLNKIHKHYVNIARIGDINNYIGIKWLSWWYKRNLIMFSNLTRLIRSKEDRILFIVGASHPAIVNQFLKESEACEIVQPLSYL